MDNKHKKMPNFISYEGNAEMMCLHTGYNFKLTDNKQGQGCSSVLEYFRKISKTNNRITSVSNAVGKSNVHSQLVGL